MGLNGAVNLVNSSGQVYWSTPADPTVCWNGEPKTYYPICLRPGTNYQSNLSYAACSYAEAQAYASKFINDGAAMGMCK